MKFRPIFIAAVTALCLAAYPICAYAEGPADIICSAEQTEIKEEIVKKVKKEITKNFPNCSEDFSGYLSLGTITSDSFYPGSSYVKVEDFIEPISNTMFRYCSPISFQRLLDGSKGLKIINNSKLCITDDALYEVYTMNEKAREIAMAELPAIVPEGLNRQQVEDLLYTYFVDNIPYCAAGRTSEAVTARYQSAYTTLLDKTGMCSSFSFAYRAYYENVPFNPGTGLTDWACDTPIYRTSYISHNPAHVWITIPQDDDSLIDYDITFGKYNAAKWMRKSHEWMAAQSGHQNPGIYY